jgi:histone deacetylase 3
MTVHEILKNLISSPSVQMQDVPSDLLSIENTEEIDPDIRNHQDENDKRYKEIISS